MPTWLRRFLPLLMAAAASVAVAVAAARRRDAAAWSAPPEWPAFDEAPVPPSAARWVVPVEDACPDGFPIKANDRSMIYHVPGGASYERTNPDRCYADRADADADGYRAAKS